MTPEKFKKNPGESRAPFRAPALQGQTKSFSAARTHKSLSAHLNGRGGWSKRPWDTESASGLWRSLHQIPPLDVALTSPRWWQKLGKKLVNWAKALCKQDFNMRPFCRQFLHIPPSRFSASGHMACSVSSEKKPHPGGYHHLPLLKDICNKILEKLPSCSWPFQLLMIHTYPWWIHHE